MAREFVEVLTDQGAQGRAIVGSTAPTGVAKVMRSDMADFAIVTLDSLAVSIKYQPDWPKKVPLVAPLGSEIIEVVASKDVKSINDLAGKSVSFGDPDGTTGISAKLLFTRLGLNVEPIYEPLADAVAAMNAGKRDAVVVLGGKEAHALDGFGDDHRCHLVAIPWSAPLDQVYAPARVAAADRPNLVAASDSVETVAAPMALVALDAPAGSPRAEAAGRSPAPSSTITSPFSPLRATSTGATSISRRAPRWRTPTGRGSPRLKGGSTITRRRPIRRWTPFGRRQKRPKPTAVRKPTIQTGFTTA